MNCQWFNHRGKSLRIFTTKSLKERLSHKSILMFVNETIQIFLNQKDPFSSTAALPFGKGTRDQILLSINTSYSSFVERFHSGAHKAEEGSAIVKRSVGCSLGLKLPFLDLV